MRAIGLIITVLFLFVGCGVSSQPKMPPPPKDFKGKHVGASVYYIEAEDLPKAFRGAYNSSMYKYKISMLLKKVGYWISGKGPKENVKLQDLHFGNKDISYGAFAYNKEQDKYFLAGTFKYDKKHLRYLSFIMVFDGQTKLLEGMYHKQKVGVSDTALAENGKAAFFANDNGGALLDLKTKQVNTINTPKNYAFGFS